MQSSLAIGHLQAFPDLFRLCTLRPLAGDSNHSTARPSPITLTHRKILRPLVAIIDSSASRPEYVQGTVLRLGRVGDGWVATKHCFAFALHAAK